MSLAALIQCSRIGVVVREAIPTPQVFQILYISVPDVLVSFWRRWFAASLQLFQIPEGVPRELSSTVNALLSRATAVSAEVRDTFYLWGGQRNRFLLHQSTPAPDSSESVSDLIMVAGNSYVQVLEFSVCCQLGS